LQHTSPPQSLPDDDGTGSISPVHLKTPASPMDASVQVTLTRHPERLLVERLEYDLLFRWFIGIGVEDVAWDHSVFSKNRDRLLEGDIAAKFLAAVLAQPKDEEASVERSLLGRWHADRSRGLGGSVPAIRHNPRLLHAEDEPPITQRNIGSLVGTLGKRVLHLCNSPGQIGHRAIYNLASRIKFAKLVSCGWRIVCPKPSGA
jgi:hypothetical protein